MGKGKRVWFLGGGCCFVCNYYLCSLLCESGLSLSPVSFYMLLQVTILCIMHESVAVRIFHKFSNPVANQRRENCLEWIPGKRLPLIVF